ncbi:hypothetical protein [Natronospora cellulosivora (SeqCode)]
MLNVFSVFKKDRYKSFDDVVCGKKLKSRSYKGTMPINVNDIVGSVGRYQKGDSISIDKESYRYKKIKKLLENLNNVPAIKVYNIDHDYYIVDGHHRVEASKEIGKEYLDAEVIEFKYH